MDSFDRAENARALHERRRNNTCEKANTAIDELIAEGKRVSFKAVAERAGLSTATLYNHNELRERIEKLRGEACSLKPVYAKPRSSEAAVIESLKRKVARLTQENEHLRKENERLKNAANTIYSNYMDAL